MSLRALRQQGETIHKITGNPLESTFARCVDTRIIRSRIQDKKTRDVESGF
ncbi:hypothetical protein [Helicobacter zhangjianzhongii]|uniref:Uncharacterized protein n=1 Tax=Helicobacter zhangjianzhongii TaxID=2974574 RepID=A0ACC6FQX9_9HELI|nr:MULTISPECIES: hypothetical protein [unclassified Helicobacter]MDL0079500.1 hypothetical protein [Helicobacter sp. CPD2-1]MDL0081599.1 hypothetical protein [Helicobacter sp. XJK30-2]